MNDERPPGDEQQPEPAPGDRALPIGGEAYEAPEIREDLEEALAGEGFADRARSQLEAAGCVSGCAAWFVAIALLAMVGAALALAILRGDDPGFSGTPGNGSDGASETIVDAEDVPGDGEDGTDGGAPDPTNAGFLPRTGVWEIENLPFLPACGPGDLGSGFDEGVITVLDDGNRLTATGSREGTASFDLVLVEASGERLVYVGAEPITGLELTMTFRSPTELDASIASGGERCLERPATGVWDREIGTPDPDAEPATEAPPWLPSGLPVSGAGEVLTDDAGDTGTFRLVVIDTSPGQVLFEIGTWAADQGFVQLIEPGTSIVYEMGDGRRMVVDAVAVGSDVELTIMVERG